MLLLEDHYVQFTMIAINLEWGENIFVYLFYEKLYVPLLYILM